MRFLESGGKKETAEELSKDTEEQQPPEEEDVEVSESRPSVEVCACAIERPVGTINNKHIRPIFSFILTGFAFHEVSVQPQMKIWRQFNS